jgi:hypothetical protein
MFKERPNYTLPEKLDVPVWRYMDIARLISMLENSALYFCRADKLGDQFECSLPSAFFKEINAEPESRRQSMQWRQAELERLKQQPEMERLKQQHPGMNLGFERAELRQMLGMQELLRRSEHMVKLVSDRYTDYARYAHSHMYIN